MRGLFVAAALMACVAGTSGILANVDGTRSTGLSTPSRQSEPDINKIRVVQAGEPVSTGNPSVAPFKWVGMLINPTPTQKNPNLVDECTGQFIRPNVVLTAAHCLKNLQSNPSGAWYDVSKQRFILQYQNGEGSHTFNTICAATPSLFAYPQNYDAMSADQKDAVLPNTAQHDFGMILVDGTSPTGVMPVALDWKGKVTAAVRIGYAANILDGEIIQKALGAVFFANAIPMFSSPPPNLVVHWQSITDLTNGTSGGAWIANFDTTEGPNNNFLIAVTSFGSEKYPGAIFGAYLTAAEFNPLLNFTLNGCK
jgi:hypothetical protein